MKAAPIVCAVSALLFTLLLPLTARAQTANVHFEALSGTHAPGTQPGFTWYSFGGGAISDDGEITFRAFIDRNDGGTDQIGLWRGSGGNFTLVTRSDDTAPGAGTGAVFDEPFAPAYRAANGVAPKPLAFYATVNTGSTILPSFWSFANGSLTKLVVQGDPAPGGQTYERFFQRDFCLADDGSPVIVGEAGGGLGTIWYATNGTVSLAVQDGQTVPGLTQGTFAVGTQPVVAVTGGPDPKIAYYAGIINGPLIRPGVGRGWGLFTQRFGQAPVASRLQADNVASIPGAYYNQLTDFDINANGLFAYRATLAAIDPMQFPSPVNDSNDEGVFLGDSLLVRKGEASPIGGFKFVSFEDIAINKSGNVAFLAGLEDSTGNPGAMICLADGSDRFVIAATGNQAPGAPEGVTFAFFANIAQGRIQLNNRGQVVFLATDSAGRGGLWGGDRDGNLQLLARVGNEVEIAPGDVRTVTGINFLNRLTVGSGGSDGHARGLNDSGQVVFGLTFSDGTSGMGFAAVNGGNVAPGGNSSGNFEESITAGDPVNTRNGELLDFATDLNLRGPMPLLFGRYYAARLSTDGKLTSALGPNWLSNFDAKLTVTGDTAEAVTNNGRVMLFTKANNVWSLTAPLDIPFQLAESGADFVLADPRSQRLHTFDAGGRLTRIEDGRGNAHALTYDGNGLLTNVRDGLGRNLTFAYDVGGRLVTVSDGTRSVHYAHDAEGNLVSVTDVLNRTTNYSYAAGGLLTSTVLPRGNAPITQAFATAKVVSQVEHPASGVTQASSFAYDAAARTATITDPTGQSRVHGYSSDGALSSFRDEEGGVITLNPDPSGRRSEVTDQLGNTTSISFHAQSGRPEQITNAEGRSATFTYAARKVGGITFYDLVKTVRADGSVRTFTYDAKGNVLIATDPLGKKTTYTYNARGQLTRSTDPTNAVLSYTYDDATGNLKTSKDSDTGETTYTCDAFSRLTRLTHPDGSHFDITYDAADRVVQVIDEQARTTSFAYDPNDNLIGIVDAASQSMQLSYDDLDRLIQLTDRLGRTHRRAFDSRDLVASETDALDRTTSFTHDARRRTTRVTDPGNATVSFAYDEVGRLVRVSDALGHTDNVARNRLGRPIAESNALGHTIQFERDSLQRITRLIDPLGRQNSLIYDKAGRLIASSRDGLGTGNYARDAAGRVLKITDPNGGVRSYGYTTAGRLKTTTDPLGRATTLDYDKRGRVAKVTLPGDGACAITRDGTDRVTRLNFSEGPLELNYSFDNLGRLLNATDSADAANNVAFSYDAEGRLLSSANGGLTFTGTYDDVGRLTSLNYGGLFTVMYTYDSRDRCTRVRDDLAGGGQVDFVYDDAGRLTSVARNNGTASTYIHDNADRIVRVQHTIGGKDFIDLKYALNAAADLTQMDVTAPLLPAVSEVSQSFKFDKASQIVGTDYSYDSRGRLTASPGHTFGWNAASRLQSIDAVTLKYNPLGEIASRTDAKDTVKFSHIHALPNQPIGALLGDTSKSCFVWTPDGRLLYAVDFTGGTAQPPRYYHFDRLGSTLATTDNAGAILTKYAYGPYGELLAGSSPADVFLFIGELGVRAEGPVYQMGDRYYDPETARFLSRDSAPPRLTDPRSLDPYLYALGNPTRYVDPTGTESYDGTFYKTAIVGKTTNENSEAAYLGLYTLFCNIAGVDLQGVNVEVPYVPMYVEQPELPRQEAFNQELNGVLRKSRELELAFSEAQIAGERFAALSRNESPGEPGGDDAISDEQETGSKSESMVEQALEVSGADPDVVADAIPISGETDESPRPVSPPAALRRDGGGNPGGPITDAFNKFVNKFNKAIGLAGDAEKFKKHKDKLQKKMEKAKAKAEEEQAKQNKEEAKKKYLQKE